MLLVGCEDGHCYWLVVRADTANHMYISRGVWDAFFSLHMGNNDREISKVGMESLGKSGNSFAKSSENPEIYLILYYIFRMHLD